MRVGVIGIGQAGGRIADVLTYHSEWGRHKGIVPFAIAVNSAQADLLGLKTINKNSIIFYSIHYLQPIFIPHINYFIKFICNFL